MVISYGKCNSCKRYGMNRCFWYCETETAPLYLCPTCFTEFDTALAAVEWQTLNGSDEMDSFW